MVGVGHVFDISQQVRDIIEYSVPDVIALELDWKRLQALLSPSSSNRQPFFYALLAAVQQRIAKKYGISTGTEMRAAIAAAKKRGIGIMCIDMDVQQLFRKAWYSMELKRKISLILGSVLSLGISKKRVERELASFEADPTVYLEELKTHFPELATIFIDERNQHMARHIVKALPFHDNMVVFVGEGHIVGLESLLEKEVPVTTIHLRELRNNSWRQKLTEGNP